MKVENKQHISDVGEGTIRCWRVRIIYTKESHLHVRKLIQYIKN